MIKIELSMPAPQSRGPKHQNLYIVILPYINDKTRGDEYFVMISFEKHLLRLFQLKKGGKTHGVCDRCE
jgi:hypothetical protein